MPRATWRPPPNWPVPPAGWTPPPDWQPDPTWSPAPAGWSFWSDDNSSTAAQSRDSSEEAGPVLGHRAQRKWRKAEAGLRAQLDTGEETRAFFLANTLRPLTDFIAVTSTRVLAGAASDLSRSEPRLRSVGLTDIADVEVELAAMTRNPKLTLRRLDGSRVVLGQLLENNDEALFRAALPASTQSAPTASAVPTVPPPNIPAATDPPPPTTPGVTTHGPVATALPPAPSPPEPERTATETRISRLLDESVIDQDQATYIRFVLFG